MGENSKIEWCDHTFNPWIGCQKCSDGCKFCYAERDFTRKPRWANCWGPPETSERKRTSQANWRKPLAWNRQAQATGMRAKVFCASLCDVFEDNPQVAVWRHELFENVIYETPWLQWLLLTKRPQRMFEFFDNRPEMLKENVWIGVSVENQAAADERIPLLLQTPAAVRFMSCEPLLGSVDLLPYLANNSLFKAQHYAGEFNFHGEEQADGSVIAICNDGTEFYDGIDLHWVIVGGESGPGARPMHPGWARSLRDQATAAGVPFFFKQWGEFGHWSQNHQLTLDEWMDRFPGKEFLRVGKKAAGRLLDGREWNEFPEVNYG